MKLKIPFSNLIILVMLVSCGKKPQTEEQTLKEKLNPSREEVFFLAMRDLRKAINENNLVAVKKVIQENPGIDLNQILTETGETFLTLSIKKDYREIRNFLIDKGCHLEKANVYKETPLIAAVISERVNSVKVLLDARVDLEKKTINKDTALHIALKKGNDEIALLLLKQGANVNATDARDNNALKLASEFNVTRSLEFIRGVMNIELGAPDVGTFRNILLDADHKRLTNVLTRYPRIATEKVYQSINPLALLVDSKDEKNAIRSAEVLLYHETNVNGPEGAEQTPLIKATVSFKKSFANLYLSSQANPQLVDKDGKSALIHAVELNNPDMVELLLSYSAVEKYTLRKEGKRVTFNACESAKRVAKSLKTDQERDANLKIKRALDCGLLSWFI
jgi:ankyrin repeat protein